MLPVSWRQLIVAVLGAPIALALSAQPLLVHSDGEYLRVSAPQLQFITGKTLDRLHDGGSVAFLGQLTVSLDSNATVQARSAARFAISYDIWEEKFAVTRIQQTRRTVSHLSLNAAQNWIVDNLTINASDLPPDRPFWVRFELRTEDPHDGLGVIGGSGISLTRLIEVFSRPAGATQLRWTLDAGPLYRADIHRLPRGA